MSLVVAIKKDGVVYLGADTRTTRGEHIRTNLAPTDLKIHKMGTCYVGAVGTVANSQILTSHSEWFDLKGTLTKKFLVQSVIPKFYEAVKSMDKIKSGENEGNLPKCGCEFIVTDGVGLFKIDNDFEVMEMSRFVQIGCTEDIAFTLLRSAIDEYSPNEMILKALRVSSYRNDGVGAPYILVNTRDNEFEIVEV